jgi:hypothetical protein
VPITRVKLFYSCKEYDQKYERASTRGNISSMPWKTECLGINEDQFLLENYFLSYTVMCIIPLTPLHAYLLSGTITTFYINYVLEVGMCASTKYTLLQRCILVQQYAATYCGIGSVVH